MVQGEHAFRWRTAKCVRQMCFQHFKRVGRLRTVQSKFELIRTSPGPEKLQRHVRTGRIFVIVCKRPAFDKTVPGIQSPRRDIPLGRACLQRQGRIPTITRDADQMGDDPVSNASTPVFVNDMHRLDLTGLSAQLFERCAANRDIAIPNGPETDFRHNQPIDIQCMPDTRWHRCSEVQMTLQKVDGMIQPGVVEEYPELIQSQFGQLNSDFAAAPPYPPTSLARRQTL